MASYIISYDWFDEIGYEEALADDMYADEWDFVYEGGVETFEGTEEALVEHLFQMEKEGCINIRFFDESDEDFIGAIWFYDYKESKGLVA